MFQVKICGITTLADAEMCASLGADAIGLNFYTRSRRCVALTTACKIRRACGAQLKLIGVFVNSPVEEIRRFAAEVPLDGIQLHGDEPPETAAELPGTQIIRAFRLTRDVDTKEMRDHLQDMAITRPPDAVLVDAFKPDQYGGTGEVLQWESLAAATAGWLELPLVLAGGLNPANVASAIKAVRPSGVDTASGVEVAPGAKDRESVRKFVATAKQTMAQLSRDDGR